jgi:hypothetical protein
VRTLVISDLHLGAATGVDLLRRPALREPLERALADVDRLVILGDGVELRDEPQRSAARHALPFFAAVGAALGPGKELVVVPGNHDHGMLAGWIDGRLLTEPTGFLGLEERVAPAAAGPLAVRLAAAAQEEAGSDLRVEIAYPGLWLRDDVYALHGHYSDVHTTVPTFERLAAGLMARIAVPLPQRGATPDDYEAVMAPLYAWAHVLTQRSDRTVVSAGGGISARAWVALGGSGRRSAAHRARAAMLGLGYAAAVATLNAAGIGPLRRDLSGAALRQGGLHGIGEVVDRLGIPAAHVLWGHSHRSGPWPGDDPAEWTAPNGSRIHNTGSWVYQRHFLSGRPNESPYWPGTAIEVSDDGSPPRLRRLLGERGHAELAPVVARPGAATPAPAPA